jgi:hypothetical protein
MDFQTATDEVYRVEQNAKDYSPPKLSKEEAERALELSPPDLSGMEYPDIVSQYMRLEKIISASSMDEGLFGEAPAAPTGAAPAPGKAEEVAQEMQKISLESAKEAAKISRPAPGIKSELKVSERLPIPGISRTPASPKTIIKEEAPPPPPEIPGIREGDEAELQKTVEAGPAQEEGAKVPETPEIPKPAEEAVEQEAAPAEAEGEPMRAEELPSAEEGWEMPLGEPSSAGAEESEAPTPPAPPEEVAAESPKADAEVPFGFEELPDELPSSSKKASLMEMDTLTAKIRIPFPASLSESPVEKAEEVIAKLETQLGAQMKGKRKKKVDTADTKKRMLELTRELFKERSMNRRAEIKKEIVMLKDLLTQSGKPAKADTGGLPEGSMYSALRSEQDYEFKEALDRVQEIYEDNKKLLVSAMDARRAVEHRESAFEEFSKSMVDLEQGLDSLIGKYQDFLTQKHTAELEKLEERGQATKDSAKLAAGLADNYAHEFSSLKNTIGEQIHSQIESTRSVLFESAGDPGARDLSQVANAPEESVFNFLQAKDSRTYEKYARGEISRAEAIAYARRLMAKDAGLDEDTINKSFGSK